MGRPKKEAPPEEVAGAPLWMVTFSDCMNLLLTFFVLLVTFSEFGEEQQERILNFGSAVRSVFGTPRGMEGSQDESSMVPDRQVVGTEQPEYGSETPTDSTSPAAHNGTLNEDLQAADYRNHKVFLIPSRKVFLGRGQGPVARRTVFSGRDGRLSEGNAGQRSSSARTGPQDQAGSTETAACHEPWPCSSISSRCRTWIVRSSVSRQRASPLPKEANGSALAYHRDERMLEIVLLEGSVQ